MVGDGLSAFIIVFQARLLLRTRGDLVLEDAEPHIFRLGLAHLKCMQVGGPIESRDGHWPRHAVGHWYGIASSSEQT